MTTALLLDAARLPDTAWAPGIAMMPNTNVQVQIQIHGEERATLKVTAS